MALEKICLFCVISVSLLQIITSDYIAAVVEYQPISLATPNETVEANLQQYVYYIEQAKIAQAQIIVFPEYGLTGIFKDPEGYAIEIPKSDSGQTFTDFWLQKLSNTAVAHSMYIVVNLLEKTTNSANITNYYNTDIVFDKTGKIIAKYHKINLFEEPNITPGIPAENQVTFTTDFGITFGLFTCYDMTFKNPGKTVLANSNVTDVVFPTAWLSLLPFYHSLSMQSGYAVANGVNVLAANLNSPQMGIGGSGMHGADGSVYKYYLSGTAGSKLLISNINNTPRSKGLGGPLRSFDVLDNDVAVTADYNASRLFDHEKYIFKTLNISQKNIVDEVCYKSFCCKFHINISSTAVNPSEVYKIMAYNGPVVIVPNSIKRENQKICCLVACEGPDSSTCAKQNIKLSTKFENILVEVDIPNDGQAFYQPVSLTTNLLPVFNTTYNSTLVNGVEKLTFSNKFEQDNLVVFGILGAGNSAINTSVYSIVLLFGVLFINCVLSR